MDSKKKYEELVADGEINNLPKWFKGQVYPKGGSVTNPFSGEEYYLNAQELSMYDFINCSISSFSWSEYFSSIFGLK